MTVFDGLRGASKRLIDKFGEDVVWRRNSNGTPSDADKPWLANTEVTEVGVKMVFLPDDRDQRETKNYEMRTQVTKGNTSALTYGLTFEPQLKDVIVRDAKTYAVESIVVVQPNSESPLLYQLRLG